MVFVLPRRSNSRSCKARKSFGCKSMADIADFIEEKCAVISQFEPAALLDQCSGECTLFMTEQFALHQS